ncbi:unnamed protein product [Urochloa decumbens]|uniref:J domain-containing protein n=1 Tax=Urochloa decumbens TaxID=240449 RepID=A0ABC8X0Q2_9POAL
MADAIATMKEGQARKARELAEKCFLAGDVHGARQRMQSAVRLAPALPGTAQIVAAYDVHAAAAGRRAPDCWYAVLGLLQQQKKKASGAPPITHDDVKRQHRRLCLLVHPDKNPSAAADGAFKLVHAAWEELSCRHPPGDAPLAPAPAKEPQPPPASPPAPRPAPQPRKKDPPPKPPEPEPKRKPRKQDPPPEPKPRKQDPPPKPTPEPKPKWKPRPPRPQPVPRQPSPPPKPRPPPPPPTPKPKQTPRQQPTRRQKPPEESWQSSPAPPTTDRRSYSPAENECQACGACTINGRRILRCGNCQWSPMDNMPAADFDDDFFEEEYFY